MIIFLLIGCNGCATNLLLYDHDYYEDALLRFEDNDHDGFTEAQGDCDDLRPDVNPDRVEVCNSRDDDCDTEIDVGAIDALTWFQDRDSDGYGNVNAKLSQCVPPEGYTTIEGDCNDESAAAYPDADEDCDDPTDLDCDGIPGNVDNDEDGYRSCEDCDDDNAAINLDGIEVCNGVDDNCDGGIDDAQAQEAVVYYQDTDQDGFGNSTTIEQCEPPAGYTVYPGDCDDTLSAVNPSATEVCGDGVDDDCDGTGNGCRPEGELTPGGTLYGYPAGGLVGLGDVNGDGTDDLAAKGADTLGSRGSMYVVLSPVLGDLSLDSAASAIINGPEETTKFGHDFSRAGDFGNDGVADWAVQAFLGAATEGNGVLYIVPEQTRSIDLSLSDMRVSLFGTEEGAQLGWAWSTPGDLWGSADPDLVVTQPFAAEYADYAGAVRIFEDPAGSLTEFDAVYTLWGQTEELYFGTGVEVVDIDADGVDDLLVGASGIVEGGTPGGGVFVFHGPVLEDRVAASADALLLGEAESWAGEWLVSPGDATGDGLADVWVGAPHSPEVAEDAGEVYLVAELGVSQDIRSASVFTAQGEARSDYFGNGEATVADLDQDGFTDLLVSAQLNDQVADTSGKGYLFYGPFAGTYGAESADAWMLGRGEGAILASCFAPGDLDGDGNIDLSCAEGDVEGDPYSRINLYYGYSF